MNEKIKFHYNQMCNYCAKSERCTSDVAKKLKSADLSSTEIIEIIQALEKEKYIDNLRFATAFARDKFRFNKWGKTKISFELAMRKIPQPIINEVVSTIESEDIELMLAELLIKKKAAIRNEEANKVKLKLFRFAVSKGFEPEMVYKAVSKVLTQNFDELNE